MKKAKGNLPTETEDKVEFLDRDQDFSDCRSGLKDSGEGDWIKFGDTGSTVYLGLW